MNEIIDRYTLSSINLVSKTLFVYAHTYKDSYITVKLILERLSRLKKIQEYSKNIYVSCTLPRIFQKMFIDDTSLYFTGYTPSKRYMHNKFIQIGTSKDADSDTSIIIYKEDVSEFDPNTDLLIYKRDSTVTLQDKFFTNVIEKLLNSTITHSQFLSFLNDESLDMEYIIIYSGKLFYA